MTIFLKNQVKIAIFGNFSRNSWNFMKFLKKPAENISKFLRYGKKLCRLMMTHDNLPSEIFNFTKLKFLDFKAIPCRDFTCFLVKMAKIAIFELIGAQNMVNCVPSRRSATKSQKWPKTSAVKVSPAWRTSKLWRAILADPKWRLVTVKVLP